MVTMTEPACVVETLMSDISGYGKTTIVVGTGNEGASGGHTSGQAVPEMEEEIEFLIAPYETGLGSALEKLRRYFYYCVDYPRGRVPAAPLTAGWGLKL